MNAARKQRGIRKYMEESCGRECGFAMVLVLAALLMLAILGATSLLLMVSTLKGTENNKPESRAFQVAKAGLNVAHAAIVSNEVGPEGYEISGEIMGGTYEVEVIPLGGYDYTITSSGEYWEGGTPYRRKIQETAEYSAERSFDAMRNYIMFAGRDLTINIDEESTNLNPIIFNGNIRAERNLNIFVAPKVKIPDGLTVNGNVEGKESVNIVVTPGGGGSQEAKCNVYGNIRAGDLRTSGPGVVNLRTEGSNQASGIINASVGGVKVWDITSTSLTTQVLGKNDVINTGDVVNGSGVEKVFLPEPDLAYYEVLARDQDNYYMGDTTITGDLGAMGVSSLAVVYCTGNLTLQNVSWNDPDMKGIFVCEGDFITNTTSTLKFNNTSLFQVVAGGNITFHNDWQFPKGDSSSEFFFYSGGSVYLELAMFAEQVLQITAVQDIYLQGKKDPSHKTPSIVNYRGPDVDIAAWPVDIRVYDWKELPSHE